MLGANHVSFANQCTQGERADALLAEARHEEAEAAYLELLGQVKASRRIDSFIVAKIALGLLLCRIGRDARSEAHALWVQGIDDGELGLGIYGLEHGKTSVHDLIIYFLVSAHLHSLGTDRDEALAGVNDFIGRVCSYAFEKSPALLPLALSNWKRHLMEIYGGAIPEPALKSCMEAERRHGQAVSITPLRFPTPSRWVVDWGGPDDKATVFGPDGSIERVPTAEVDAIPDQGDGERRGLWARLLGR